MVDPSTRPGLLIAFEGIDGCGKSTQIARCRAWLAEHAARSVEVLREPGGTDLGEHVREWLLHGENRDPLTEMLLYMASRAELYRARVLPLLDAGAVVLLDRSHYSTAAYQGAGLGLDEARIFDLAAWATGGRRPDRVVWLDLPVAAAEDRRRAAARHREAGTRAAGGVPSRDPHDAAPAGDDRIERRGRAYFERVVAAYRRYAADDPARWLVLDATASVEDVAARIREDLSDVL